MFTGIIEAIGSISTLTDLGDNFRLVVKTGKMDMGDVHLGDSIATSGVCLTVVDKGSDFYAADVSAETIKLTGFAHYSVGHKVNLEKAMLTNSRFGGHIVSGHVDGVGKVEAINEHSNYIEVWVKAPAELAKYIAHKGSITVDGVSLTVNEVKGASFMLWLIPHTLKETVIGQYKVGTHVNLEVDVIARYLERLLLGDKAADDNTHAGSDLSMAFLAEHGYLK
ncbi:riboflavin synthase [Glaciecola punicea ACAM 611]|jgi:riboflavin synthase|uniref:Riboflavin synthase n=1 Tax=Glaciecola punicea ACAM 611 TaxID=1121923 RepID=H5T7S5_9ALTE|nr:riboflavin synthase [Glaciecola punicea]GAB54352.1 riboflavin synthase [Glaciecola punicea ACAM 611]